MVDGDAFAIGGMDNIELVAVYTDHQGYVADAGTLAAFEEGEIADLYTAFVYLLPEGVQLAAGGRDGIAEFLEQEVHKARTVEALGRFATVYIRRTDVLAGHTDHLIRQRKIGIGMQGNAFGTLCIALQRKSGDSQGEEYVDNGFFHCIANKRPSAFYLKNTAVIFLLFGPGRWPCRFLYRAERLFFVP